LPSLARTLQNLYLQLHRGKGFFVICGIDYEKYTSLPMPLSRPIHLELKIHDIQIAAL